MKKTLLFIVILVPLGLAACGPTDRINTNAVPPPNSAVATPVPTTWVPKDGNYDGRGIVTKIKTDIGTIEIDHEEIPGMMSAMKMEFNVRDKTQLNGLAVGDKVDFTVEYKNRNETIVKIAKAK